MRGILPLAASTLSRRLIPRKRHCARYSKRYLREGESSLFVPAAATGGTISNKSFPSPLSPDGRARSFDPWGSNIRFSGSSRYAVGEKFGTRMACLWNPWKPDFVGIRRHAYRPIRLLLTEREKLLGERNILGGFRHPEDRKGVGVFLVSDEIVNDGKQSDR
jgi:hypothetical protein